MVAYAFGSDWYLFQLNVLVKSDFNHWSSFALSWVDKVTSYKVVANLSAPVKLVITPVDDYVKMKLTSQLINDISRVLPELLEYFNGTIISTSF